MRAALLASAKERAENIMIVDLLRNDLGRLAQPGKVRVEALCEAEAYPTLWQMVSTVAADLPGRGLADLFGALFPCGSITGAPKIRAMQRIAELEARRAGLYTGALGWLAPGGDCRFNVAIRTVEVDPDRRATLGVGSGIVADADPDRICRVPAQGEFLTGFRSRLRTQSKRCAWRPAVSRCWPCISIACRRRHAAWVLPARCRRLSAALAAEASARPTGVFRVRLTLAHDGGYRRSSVAAGRPSRQALAGGAGGRALAADDYLLRHKTTARARYDCALAALAARPEVFDAIFLNTRGEVCEGRAATSLSSAMGSC
jgi:para-aminobenzoate synthetase/4-amino-4-deoxychorismate lyase